MHLLNNENIYTYTCTEQIHLLQYEAMNFDFLHQYQFQEIEFIIYENKFKLQNNSVVIVYNKYNTVAETSIVLNEF